MKHGLTKFSFGMLLLLATAISGSTTFATGYYGPVIYLEDGGKNLADSPEFYWAMELRRLASHFHPEEKLVSSPPAPDPYEDLAAANLRKSEFTSKVDAADFAAALQAGAIKPADPAQAAQQHEAARAAILTAGSQTPTPLPAEFDSEFADYHRAAYAYAQGKEHWEEARQAWEKLLQRPPEQRRFRTLWATFMLGKLALKKGEPAAPNYFQQTRQLAKEGYVDSLGMAADSYGWEARCEWKQNRPEKAAPLYLTQLALGDESAVISLKALIPAREAIDGMLNYGPEPGERDTWTEEQMREETQKTELAWKACAMDPLLRRLVTVHILATQVNGDYFGDPEATTRRAKRWLEAIREAKVEKMEEAEYLGWVAYGIGNYQEAARWLELAQADRPAACWLRAKLEWRAGKSEAAAASMAEAWKTIRSSSAYTGWKAPRPDFPEDRTQWELGDNMTLGEYAGGDLAALHLSRGDFMQALEIFLQGGLWLDAAYLAERVLTTEELIAFVDEFPAAATPVAAELNEKLRYLLGRRLVRENRFDEAKRYIRSPYDQVVEVYAQAVQDGQDQKLEKQARARAWFAAAWVARRDGMEFMGTEAAPDGFSNGGAFEMTDLAKERQKGTYQK